MPEPVIDKIGNVKTLIVNNYVDHIDKPAYLLGVFYDGDLGKAVLQFLSEKGSELVLLPDPTNHKPYFLAKDSLEHVMSNKNIVNYPGFESAVDVVKIDPLTGNKIRLTKIITKTPTDVAKLRGYVSKAWEAKIKYHDNYIHDLGLIPGMKYVLNDAGRKQFVLIKPKISEQTIEIVKKIFSSEDPEFQVKIIEEWLPLFEELPPKAEKLILDIEVYTPFRGRVPSPKLAEYPIISVALIDSRGLKKVLVLAKEFKWDEIPDEYPRDVVVEVFDTEEALILETIRMITSYPVIVTFNGDNFDLLYIYTRALKLGIPREILPFRIGEDIVRVKSGIHIDLYKFFNNRAIRAYAFKGKYQEVNLDSVASALIGASKITVIENIGDLPFPKLVAYNYRDSELTYGLITFNNDLVWNLMVLLARISKTSIEEICRKSISKWIQNQFYWEHRRLNYLIPEPDDIKRYGKASLTKATIEGKKYAGALVINPPRGVLFNVYVLDVASLYPSVIKKYNLSYETVDRVNCSEDKRLDITDETNNKIHYVCIEKPGLTAQITGLLRDFRVHVYKKKAKQKDITPEQQAWYEIVQQAIKVFINASYGVFGAENFPLYSPAVAESVTALGRKSLYQILKKSAEIGVRVVYGDTDSIFIWNPTEEQIAKLQDWVSKKLGLEIELDKVFTYVLFTGLKKNYVGRMKDGGIEIKGLMAKKRNTPEFLKELFEELKEKLKSIETPYDFIDFKKWLENEVKNLYKSLKSKEITLDKLAFKVGITKKLGEYLKTKPPHVKAALQLKNLGYNIQEGDIVAFVKVKGGEGYKAIQLTKLHEIDPDKYIEIINSALSQLLGAFGIEWEDIIGVKKLRETMLPT